MTPSDRNVVVYKRVSSDRQDLARQGAQHEHAERSGAATPRPI